MKIIDRYILSRFLVNFFSGFFIIILIFVFHTIWLYIDEFAGKGISLWIIVKFIGLFLPNLIPIILPLTVVLSSIMTLGSLAENYELAAMKSSGMSLLRMVRVLIIFMFGLSCLVFFTLNNLQPVTFRMAGDLRENIKKVQPSLAITEGIFSQIDNYSIKVQRKSGERGQFLHDVIIHQNEKGENTTLIKAEKGELISDTNSDVLQLMLQNGTYYKDIKNDQNPQNFPFAKTQFETYILNIDISHLNQEVDFNEATDRTSFRTMNVRELSATLDSLQTDYKDEATSLGRTIHRRTGIIYNYNPAPSNTEKQRDTIRTISDLMAQIKDLNRKEQLFGVAKDNNRTLLSSFEYRSDDLIFRDKVIRLYALTLSDKFALAFTCFVLFFVAAPLGAFIRKGGIGLPLVVAMGVFLSYYFLGLFIKNIAETGGLNPFVAPWIPTFVLLPLGAYLTFRINKDKPIFQFGELFNKLKILFKNNGK